MPTSLCTGLHDPCDFCTPCTKVTGTWHVTHCRVTWVGFNCQGYNIKIRNRKSDSPRLLETRSQRLVRRPRAVHCNLLP